MSNGTGTDVEVLVQGRAAEDIQAVALVATGFVMNEATHLRPERLEAYQAEHATTILGWVRSPEELQHWAARSDYPLREPTVFQAWHRDPDVTPYVLVHGDEVCGYGEIWQDATDGTAELARLIIAPAARGQGLGQRLVELLSEQVAGLGYERIWMRVAPSNVTALRCYQRAGFDRVPPWQEQEMNRGERQAYVWLFKNSRL